MASKDAAKQKELKDGNYTHLWTIVDDGGATGIAITDNTVNPAEVDLSGIDDSEVAVIVILFNFDGKVDRIYCGRDISRSIFEELICSLSYEKICNLPSIMKVKHKNYRPPRIEFSIGSYCLKYPDDLEYGCN